MGVHEVRNQVLEWAARHHDRELLDGARVWLGDEPARGVALDSALAFAILAPAGDGPDLVTRWDAAGHRRRAERLVADAWRAAWFSVLRVVGVEWDQGLHLHDVIHDRRVFVHERAGSRALRPGDWLAGFYFRRDGRFELEGTVRQVAEVARVHAVQAALRARAAAGPGPDDAGRSRRMARPVVAAIVAAARAPRFVNADGHPIAVVSARLAVPWARVVEVVSRWPDAVAEPGLFEVTGLVPVEFSGGAAIRAVFRDDHGATVFANSRERFDDVLARWARETGSPLPIERETVRPLPPAHPEGAVVVTDTTRVTAADAASGAREFLADADAAWPDQRVPALDGLTPREAVAAGRVPEVLALLPGDERGAAVAAALGLDA